MSCRFLSAPYVILLAILIAAPGAASAADRSDVNSIVQEALQAEVDGDTTQRESRLADALGQEPEHPSARWHSGHVRINDNWLTVEQAEESAGNDETVAAYRNLRDRQSGTLAGELSLARWCRKNGLEDRERMHWANLLRIDPSNKEARGRLGVREFRGQLLTSEQIEDWKQGIKEYQGALKEWDSTLRRWRREIESSATPRRTEAWRQLMSLYDARAVPSLEKVLYQAEPGLQLDIVSVLGNIEDQTATDVLVRLALHARDSEVREAAAKELAERSLFGFVPSLLARLETPIEYRYAMQTLGAGVVSGFYSSQENPTAVLKVSHTVSTGIPVYIVPEQRTERNIVRMKLLQQQKIAEEAARQYRRIAESVQTVEKKNAQTIWFNDRVYAVLKTSTGQRWESQPKYWWDWWKDYNELDDSEEKPYINLRQSRRYDRPIRLSNCSCFAAGTPVWTETGPVAIERVRRGDRVLSQDPDSGELGYQLVLDTTIRPASPTLKIQVADDQIEATPIVATLGHPLWVIGRGWRMAKELNTGDQLHSVGGAIAINKIEPGPLAKAYNLVVAETNTYFVGKQRVLVHDNMPRQAMDLPVPGWAAASY